MNETLSTLIAFVGVLIVFSMLTQSVQEALKNLFKMKAGVWESFWRSVYRSEFGLEGGTGASAASSAGMVSAAKKPGQKPGMITRLLTWFLALLKRNPVGRLDLRLNRLQINVTKATDLLHAAKVGLREIADLDLTATSLDVAGPKRQALMTTLQTLASLNLGTVFRIYKSLDESNTIPNLESKLATFLGEAPPKMLVDFQAACAALLDIITRAEQKVTEYRMRLEQRFDAWMSQVEGAYRSHMLLVTLVLGALIVVASNADAFSMYRQLSSSPQMRAAAVSHAQEVTKRSLITKGDDLNTIHTSIQAREYSEAKVMASTFCANLAADFKMFKDDSAAAKATDIKAAIDKLQATDSDIRALTEQEPELASLFVTLNKTAVESYARDVSALELPLGWSQDLKVLKTVTGVGPVSYWWMNKLAGLALTLFLITFGAPFWNDILASLVGFKNAMGNKARPGP